MFPLVTVELWRGDGDPPGGYPTQAQMSCAAAAREVKGYRVLLEGAMGECSCS